MNNKNDMNEFNKLNELNEDYQTLANLIKEK